MVAIKGAPVVRRHRRKGILYKRQSPHLCIASGSEKGAQGLESRPPLFITAYAVPVPHPTVENDTLRAVALNRIDLRDSVLHTS